MTSPAPVVLLDALGTLVALEEPGPHLVRELANRGTRITEARAREAMRAEMAFYAAEHHRADGPEALAVLRRGCAEVVLAHLGPVEVRVEAVEGALLAAVRFAAYPDAVPALRTLRALGARLVVLSNWDVSLHAVLARTGLAEHVDAALSSAEAGVAKPDPELFRRALALVGGEPADAWMVGDSVPTDIVGAQAAGIRPILVARAAGRGLGSVGAGPAAPAGVPTLPDLAGVADLVRYRRTPS